MTIKMRRKIELVIYMAIAITGWEIGKLLIRLLF